MRVYLNSVVNILLERTAEELIVGVFVALLLALAAAGVHALARRQAKDSATLMAVPVLAANLAAMVLAAAYVRTDRPGAGQAPSGMPAPPVRGRGQPALIRDLAAESIARQVFAAADLDRDGSLAPDEAAITSSRFVESAQVGPGGPVDLAALVSAIRGRLGVIELPQGHHGRGDPSVEGGPPLLLRDPAR